MEDSTRGEWMEKLINELKAMSQHEFGSWLVQNSFEEAVHQAAKADGGRKPEMTGLFKEVAIGVMRAADMPGMDNLWRIVWEEHHAYGYYEVFNGLMEYEQFFEDLRRELAQRQDRLWMLAKNRGVELEEMRRVAFELVTKMEGFRQDATAIHLLTGIMLTWYDAILALARTIASEKFTAVGK